MTASVGTEIHVERAAGALGAIITGVDLSESVDDRTVAAFRLAFLENLVRKKPDEPIYRYHLALVLLQKGQTFRAKQELKTALASHPSVDESGKIKEQLAKMGA